ncbi:MAG: sugar ABC transporter permease [Candidatus Cloacimonetes bacterium]|nr:sugar ABC transporter permease [Candidatus Cloacimonadota bacterium]
MIKRTQNNQLRFAYLWMGIILALYIVLRIIPIITSFGMSFFNWDLINPKKKYVGFKNYSKLFNDDNFLISIKNTLIFSFFVVLVSLSISLPMACALQKDFKGKGLFQSIYFIPYVIAVVPAALAWKFIYDPTGGILNRIIQFFGGIPKGWLVNDKLALPSIMIMTIWQRIGYNLVIFTVGLGEIPKDYYEAAKVDGAGKLKTFFKITMPLLMPVTIYLVIMNTIEAFNIFTPVYVMTTGTQSAPASAVKVLVMDIYQNAFRFFKMGYASAESVCLFLIVLIVSLLQMLYFKKRDK